MDRMGLVDLANDNLPSTGIVALLRDVAGQVIAQRPAMEALHRFDPELGTAVRAVPEQRSEPRSRSSAALERLAALVCHRGGQQRCVHCGQYIDRRHSCPRDHLAVTLLARQALSDHPLLFIRVANGMRPDNPARLLLQQTAEAWAAAGREAPRDIVAFAGAVCDAARVSRCDQCGAHLEDQRQVICESCQAIPPDLDEDGGDGFGDGAA